MSKTLIHVNMHKVRSNAKTGAREPVITVKGGKRNRYAHRVRIDGPSEVVYSPDKPLDCGARVWIETESPVALDKEQPPVMSKEHPGIKVLRRAITGMRNDEQGGYDGFRNGRWERDRVFGVDVSTADMAALCDLAGVVPDEIKINGHCEDCVHADDDGDEGGWRQPCCSCSRPKMTNFVPLSTLTKRRRTIDSEDERQLLVNYRSGMRVWWGTGIVHTSYGEPGHSKSMERLRAMAERLKARGLISDGAMHGRRLLIPGKLALEDWDRRHPRRKEVA